MNEPNELSSNETDPLEVGAIVGGRYELRRVLGRGAAAVVFAAEHVLVRRTVALKLPLNDPEMRELLCSRLRRETDALARVRHPAIVDVIDAGECDRMPFLAMELLEGRTLSGLISARGRLQAEETLKIGIALAEGLSAVHGAGLIHRDVKPSNVLITPSPQNQVHLCDFGIAKLQRPTETFDRKLTQAGAILGTPEYMPLEALLAATETDQRMDVYALGITLFECLTGAVPLEGTLAQLLMRLSSAKLPSVLEVRADVPPPLASVIARCIAIDPAGRYSTMTELASALRACALRSLEGLDLLRAAKPPVTLPAAAVAAAARATPVPVPVQPAPEARRNFARAPLVGVATMQRDGSPATSARLEDISEGGVLLITQEPYAAAERVRLRLSLPISGKVVALPAIVRWTRASRGAPATGLEFIDLPDVARGEIRQYVSLMTRAAR